MTTIQKLAKNIKLVILDVDGVLTDGSLFYNDSGEEYKAFNAKDGHGIRMLQDVGIKVAIITGRSSELVLHRAKNLKISPALIYQGYRDKRPAFHELLNKTGLEPKNIAYIGDDVFDLPIMLKVGLSIAVGDAHDFVKKHTHWTTKQLGGRGAVREASEMILKAQGKLDELLRNYLK